MVFGQVPRARVWKALIARGRGLGAKRAKPTVSLVTAKYPELPNRDDRGSSRLARQARQGNPY